jgi:large subunit ribosomal protein L25
MKIEKRTDKLRIVREKKLVPGVLFGKSITPMSIQVDENELHEVFNQYGKTQTFVVKLGKASHQVYIKGIQNDIINRNHILSVELLKVDKDDTISAQVPLHIIGKDLLEKEGYIVQIVDKDIEVEYQAGNAISQIDVDISAMKVRESLHVRDVKFPKGVKVVEALDKVLIHIAESKFVDKVAEEVKEEVPQAVTEEPKPKSKEETKK